MLDNHSQALGPLLDLAEQLIQTDPTARQVIVVKTAGGDLRHFLSHSAGDTSEEDAFLEALRETGDAELRLCLCMWHNGQIDVPSHHFRRRLLELSPQNAQTCIPLQGEGSVSMKTVASTMLPPR